jgi:multimeric flavodoxin WrbA
MKITILNGSPERTEGGLDGYLESLLSELARRQHVVSPLHLRDLQVHHCIGCFGCWVRTPGECALDDDGRTVARSLISSDLAILASPILMGHVSSLLRRANERLLPLIHPYAKLVDGECRHHPRYPSRPRLALLLEQGQGADAEDVAIIRGSYQMTARNFATTLAFTLTTATPVLEVVHAIARA